MFGSICPCGVEGFAWLYKQEIFVLSDSACVYERAGQRVVDAVTRTYRRAVPPVLRTVQRRRRRRQKSLARGNPRHEGTVVSVGIRG